jgi:hypothetical protein
MQSCFNAMAARAGLIARLVQGIAAEDTRTTLTAGVTIVEVVQSHQKGADQVRGLRLFVSRARAPREKSPDPGMRKAPVRTDALQLVSGRLLGPPPELGSLDDIDLGWQVACHFKTNGLLADLWFVPNLHWEYSSS